MMDKLLQDRIALVTGGATLLVGLNLAAKNRVWRWLGAV